MNGWGKGMRAAYRALEHAAKQKGGPVTESEWRDEARKMAGGKLAENYVRSVDRLAMRGALIVTEDRRYAPKLTIEDLL